MILHYLTIIFFLQLDFAMSQFVQAALAGSYSASLDPTVAINRSSYPLNDSGITTKLPSISAPMGPPTGPVQQYSAVDAKQQRITWARELKNMSPFERHLQFIKLYRQNEPAAPEDPYASLVTDDDILRTAYRFIRKPEDDAKLDAWEGKLAKSYYDRLFKEYALVDLTRYKEGKVGMRWRVQKEVFTGKGQFMCASLTCSSAQLKTFEVRPKLSRPLMFAY